MATRIAIWQRVSSAKQATTDREGLPYQEDLIAQTMAAGEYIDSGLRWVLTHSGGSVHETPQWADMISRAGRDFDLLLVPYQSRFSRDTEQTLAAVRQIHDANAAVLFCEEGINTGNESQFRQFATGAVAAEAYRKELSITMRRVSEHGWRRTGKQRGRPPLGYNADWSVNPEAAAKVQTIFEEYASGNYSIEELAARHQTAPEAMKNTLRSRVYLGESSHRIYDPARPRLSRYLRPRQYQKGIHDAIIDEDLWNAVADMRKNRSRAGGPRPQTVSALSGRLWCVCGTPIRLDGRDRQHEPRVRHVDPCEAFGRHERKRANVYLEPIKQGMAAIQLSDEAIERIIRDRPESSVRTETSPRFALKRTRIAAQLVSRQISGSQAEQALADIDEDERQWLDDQRQAQAVSLSDERLRVNLRNFAGLLAQASTSPFSDEVWNNVIRRFVQRIEHVGPDVLKIVPSAEAGASLVLATMPQHVAVGSAERPRRALSTREPLRRVRLIVEAMLP